MMEDVYKKKKIAMVCHWESPYKEEWKGGMGVYMNGLSKKLSEENFNIDFFVPKVEDYPGEQEVSPGVRIIRLNIPSTTLEEDIRNESHMNHFGNELLEYIKSNNLNYDLVHAQYWSSYPAAKKLVTEIKSPLILQLHQLQLLKEITFEKLGLMYKHDENRISYEKEAIQNSDRVILVSNEQLYDLEKHYYKGELPFDIRRKIAVIRNAIETEKYSLVSDEERRSLKKLKGINPSSTVIGFHGRVDPDKAVDRLIYATHLLKKEFPKKSIDLSIVGRGSELTKLEALVKNLEMEKVHFYGYQTGNELMETVKMIDIGVIPSIYETFGLSIAELMAFGIPTIVWKSSGGPEEVTGKIKPIIPPVNSIIDLKRKLEGLLVSPDLRKEKGIKMRERCLDKFNWKRLIYEMKKLYSELSV